MQRCPSRPTIVRGARDSSASATTSAVYRFPKTGLSAGGDGTFVLSLKRTAAGLGAQRPWGQGGGHRAARAHRLNTWRRCGLHPAPYLALRRFHGVFTGPAAPNSNDPLRGDRRSSRHRRACRPATDSAVPVAPKRPRRMNRGGAPGPALSSSYSSCLHGKASLSHELRCVDTPLRSAG